MNRLLQRLLVVISAVVFQITASAQHDGARDSVRHIANSKFDRVETTLKDKKPFAGDAESSFVLMLSHLAENQTEQAMSSARDAVSKGLPFERLMVGPRELLKKLHALDEFQIWKRQQDVSPLVHGPMVGNVSDSSASIWVRTSEPAGVVVRTQSGVESQQVFTDEQSDFTAVAMLSGLPADTSIQYVVEVAGVSLAKGSFRTFPPKLTGSKFRVGFGGGAGYVPEWESMWDTILGFQPHAFLMLGDNVYIDQPEKLLTQQYCYYRRQSRPEWKRLTSQTPMFSIWDDHDFGTNDCIPGPDIERPAWKRKVWNVFQQNWVNPGYGAGETQPGCWYDFHVGDVHFILLDGRYYRDLEGGTMLGPAQRDWLFKTLDESQATFKIIASPVPFTSGIKRGSRDPWDGFPEEREAIFRHIESKRIDGVFLIAADRHRTDLRVTRRDAGYDLYEFESSRLTNHHTHPVVQTEGLVWGYNDTCSFALMEFDTTLSDPQVIFRCVDLSGQIQHSYTLKRSRLRHP